MPEYQSHETITAALERFNKRVFNAGYSFKVYDISKNYVYVMGSFDFAYYVNVHIEFRDMVYTNLKEADKWPDAWHDDQLFLLTEDEIKKWPDEQQTPFTTTEGLFRFLFNINGKENTRTGLTICKTLYIQWQHPAYED